MGGQKQGIVNGGHKVAKTEQLHDQIYSVLVIHGVLGVNALTRELNERFSCGYAVTSVHNFLSRQNYFVKTENKKWTLPVADGQWPLNERWGETEIHPEIQAAIDDPINHLTEILKYIDQAEYMRELNTKRAAFLRGLAERAVKYNVRRNS